MFFRKEVAESPVLRELKQTVEVMLKQRAVSDRFMRIDAKEQSATALLQSKVKYYGRQAAPRSTVVFSGRNRGDKREGAGSNSSSNAGDSPREPEKV